MIRGSSVRSPSVTRPSRRGEGGREREEEGEQREEGRASHSHAHMLVTASNPYSWKTASHITHARPDGDGDGDEASSLARRHARHFGSEDVCHLNGTGS